MFLLQSLLRFLSTLFNNISKHFANQIFFFRHLNPLRERRPRGRPPKGASRRSSTPGDHQKMLSSDAPGELHAQGTTPNLVIAGALASKVELPPGNRTTEMILRSTVSKKEGIGWEQMEEKGKINDGFKMEEGKREQTVYSLFTAHFSLSIKCTHFSFSFHSFCLC
ncbi:hypothetical protein niasHT_028633 [Heterodera trifolii]|uniref:Uncharacterized protein n=1 Tax=Heterodera trifolii TaxID=157864 RepID=A0ABD2KBR6_9BILA